MKNLTKILGILACIILIIIAFMMFKKSNGSKKVEENNLLQIVNPLVEFDTIEELQQYFKAEIPVLDKQVEAYIAITEDTYATHARIKYADASSFEMEPGKEADVSGIYGGTEEKEELINGVNVKIYSYNDSDSDDITYYAIWHANNVSYSYSVVGEEMNMEELTELINKTK